MKTIYFRMLVFAVGGLLLSVSCSSDSNEPNPVEIEEPEAITDTHSYIVLRNDGQLFAIGGESGKVTTSNRVPGVVFNTVFNTVTASARALYFYEQRFDVFQGFLFVENLGASTYSGISLDFPEAEFGVEAGLVSLDWSESRNELIGLVKDNLSIEPGTLRLAGIHPETYEITNYGEVGEVPGIRSAILAGSSLYISALSNSYPQGYRLLSLNIEDKSLSPLTVPNASQPPIQLSHNQQDAKLFGFIRREDTNLIQAVRPVVYDANSQTYDVLSTDEDIAILNDFGKSFYDSKRNQHVALVGTRGFFALLKYNTNLEEATLLPLQDYSELSSLIGIIDVR